MNSNLLQTALTHHQQGDFAQAEQCYREILTTTPNDSDALELLGTLSYQNERLEEAVDLFRQALRQRPGNPDVQLKLALALHELGDYERAGEFYAKVLKRRSGDIQALFNLGEIAFQQGDFAQAVEYYTRAVKVDPRAASIRFALARALHRLNCLATAELNYRRGLELEPDNHNARVNFGVVLEQLGKFEDAEQAYRAALAGMPEDPAAQFGLANVLRATGRYAESAPVYENVLKGAPAFLPALMNLGLALEHMGRLDQAQACFQRAATHYPNAAEPLLNLGNVAVKRNDLAAAQSLYEDALKLNAEFLPAYRELGRVLRARGQLDRACEMFQHAVARAPTDGELRFHLAATLQMKGDLAGATREYLALTQIEPANAQAHNALGAAYMLQAQYDLAEASLRRAAAIEPTMGAALDNLAHLSAERGHADRALAYYADAIKAAPQASGIYSNYLFTLNYLDDVVPAQLFEQHREWWTRFGSDDATGANHRNGRDPQRRLKIGYVSPDLRTHSVAFFIEPVLARHSRDEIEVYCYSNARADATTERLRAHAARWHDTSGWPTQKLYQQVVEDGIDILVDLAGHSGGNSLPLFARKPAPIQVTYLGYPNTTGLATMDYRLTDGWADPPGQTEHLHTEQLLRLDGGFLCYQPPEAPIPPDRADTQAAGEVSFGCFNTARKLSPRTVALWARILKQLPTARLLLKSHQLKSPEYRARVLQQFAEQGVASQQLDLLDYASTIHDHLAHYRRIDVALDTFPYTGTTTTCEALWMGVPVISLAGPTHVSRVGVSILNSVGLSELAVESEDAYVAKALELADDRALLARQRHELRRRVTESTLTDSAAFARKLEAAYRRMWQDWCAGNS